MMRSVGTLTRADLAETINRKMGFSRAESLDMVEAILAKMSDALAKGELPCERRVLGDLAVAALSPKSLQGIDVLVHAAARVHVMDEVATDPQATFRAVNVEGMLRLAMAAAEAGVTQLSVDLRPLGVTGEAGS